MYRWTLLLIAVVVATVFAACGSGSDEPAQSEPAGQEQTADDMMDEMANGMMDDMPETGHMDGHDEASAVAEGARQVEVSARSFEFDPSEIRAEVGEDLAVVLTSEDILHDLTIDELDAHVAADAGETETGGVRADEAGRYTFYCTVPGHRAAGMEGTLIVG